METLGDLDVLEIKDEMVYTMHMIVDAFQHNLYITLPVPHVDIGVDNGNCHNNLGDVPFGLDCPSLIIDIITFKVTQPEHQK